MDPPTTANHQSSVDFSDKKKHPAGPKFLRHISRDSREKFISWPAIEVHCPTIGVTFPVAGSRGKSGKKIWVIFG